MIPGFVALAAAQGTLSAPTPNVRRLACAAAATTLVAGLVRVSDPSCPQPFDPGATTSDLGHAAASISTFALWAAMPIVAARDKTTGWYHRFARAMVVPTVAAFVCAGATTQLDSTFKGIAQRVFLALVFLFQAATGLALGTTDTLSA